MDSMSSVLIKELTSIVNRIQKETLPNNIDYWSTEIINLDDKYDFMCILHFSIPVKTQRVLFLVIKCDDDIHLYYVSHFFCTPPQRPLVQYIWFVCPLLSLSSSVIKLMYVYSVIVE